MNKKINEINELLNNDKLLNEYISQIDSSNIEVPNDLERKLLQQFSTNIIPIKHTQNNYKTNAINILKIAACTILSLLLWNYLTINSSKYIPQEHNNKLSAGYKEFEENFEGILKNANEYLFTPINKERIDI